MKTKEAREASGGEKKPAERNNKRISDGERERVRTCAEMVRWKVLLVEVSFETLLCGVQ